MPSEKAPYEKQYIARDFECRNPEARGAVISQEIKPDLLSNIVAPRFMMESVIAQGIAVHDIYRIVLRMFLLQDWGEEDKWKPVFEVGFRPTNWWEPGCTFYKGCIVTNDFRIYKDGLLIGAYGTGQEAHAYIDRTQT